MLQSHFTEISRWFGSVYLKVGQGFTVSGLGNRFNWEGIKERYETKRLKNDISQKNI